MADSDGENKEQGGSRPSSATLKKSKKVQDVVSEVTVKALQEFDTGHYSPDHPKEDGPAEERPKSSAEKPGSRPASAGKPASRPSSAAGKPSSRSGSRPGSAAEKPSSGRGSPAGKPASRPTSAAEKPPSQGGSDKPSSRPTSAAGKPSSRPASGEKSGSLPLSVTGEKPPSRPASAAEKPASRRGSGAEKPASRPTSSAGKPPSRPASSAGKPASRPTSAAEKPASRPASVADKPASRPASVAEKPSSRPTSAAEKPPSRAGSVAEKPASRPASAAKEAPSEEKPSSRVGSAEPLEGGEEQPPSTRENGTASQPREDTATRGSSDIRNQMDAMFRPATDPSSGGGGGDDGDDGGSDGEGDDVDVYGGRDAAEMSDDMDSDNESELVVLDPDHPLMKRFQIALKAHLLKQDEKVTLELRELTEALKKRCQEREDVGVELYGVQQELARHQMMLEQKHDDFSRTSQLRQQTEVELYDIRQCYKERQNSFNGERKKVSELQQEVENLALRLFYMMNAKEDVRSDIAVMRRAAEKADSEVVKMEAEKQKQDLFVDRLVERVDKLKEEIAMYEAQIAAQLDETKAAREALMEAQMEIEGITLEKKQLFQQWSSSLIGMRRRDEAHAAMSEALHQQQQRILALETEVDGFRRSIQKEQEQNEKLTLILNKTELDIATVKKMLSACLAKHEILKAEYATYTRMLHETEQALNRATTDKQLRQNELNALRKQIEREYLEKTKLEDEIMEKLRSQLTMDKAATYTDKLTGKMRTRTKDLDSQVAVIENEISRDALEISNTKTRIERLKKTVSELDEDIRQKNEVVSRSEAEIIRRNAIIERKQGVIDQFNKKLEQMITSAGGVEIGPLEIQINSLQKSIDASQADIIELQQMWLREQSELVKMSKEKDSQSTEVERLKKQLTIISQKKLRIESEIDTQNSEMATIERNTRNLQNDMIKLNLLLHKESGMQQELQQGTALMENDFILTLKSAEKESLELQTKLDEIKEEKERLLNSLIEAERQIMLWEKKTQLAQETRAAVDSEIGQGEMRAMKAEIHRMQVRYSQLMRQQEKMIQEMEKSVSRRDTIVSRGDAQTKMNKKVLTKGSFQRQLAESKRKIKNTIQEANACDDEIKQLRDHQRELSTHVDQKQVNVQQLQGSCDTLDGDIEHLYETKQKNMTELLAKQQKSKYYQQVKDGRYTRLCKTDAALNQESQKQNDRTQALAAIVDRLNQEFPHAQPALRKAYISLSARGIPEEA